MFKRLYNKFKKWFVNKFYVIEITPKGEYFYRYLCKIINEEWTEADYNQYYEDALKEMCKTYNISRLEAIVACYQHLKKLKQTGEFYKQ